MAAGPSKRLACDTNFPLDLADGLEVAHDFREVCRERGYSLFIAPTSIQELVALSEEGSARQQALAVKALTSLLSWGITPFDLEPVQHGLAENFSRLLRTRHLLPFEEVNDGLILGEAALAGIPLLVTADSHLLDIEGSQLAIAFADSHLSAVAVLHPRQMLRVLSGKRK